MSMVWHDSARRLLGKGPQWLNAAGSSPNKGKKKNKNKLPQSFVGVVGSLQRRRGLVAGGAGAGAGTMQRRRRKKVRTYEVTK